MKFATSLLLGAPFYLSACMSVGPNYVEPTAKGWQPKYNSQQMDMFRADGINPKFEEMFADEALTRILATVRSENKDLAEALARFEAAADRLRIAETARLPSGGASASISRERQPILGLPPEFGGAGAAPFTTYSVGINASWQPDLFGRTERNIERALADLGGLEAIAFDVERIAVAQAVSTYLSLREIEARQKLNAANGELLKNALLLTEERVQIGDAAEFDTLRQRTALSQNRAAAAALDQTRAEFVSTLSLLTGQTVPDFEQMIKETSQLDANELVVVLKDPVSIGQPVDMLRRRPDIRAAERNLASATAGIGLAAAELFPSLSLSGTAGLISDQFGEIVEGRQKRYSFGPSLSWGIFNYPQIFAEIEAQEATTRAAKAAYERTVLQALTETDSAMSRYQASLERLEALSDAAETADRSLFLATERNKVGADSLLVLLDAQRTAISARDQELAAQFEALRERIDILVSLGG